MRRSCGFLLLLMGIFLVVLALDSDRAIGTGIAAALRSSAHYRTIMLLVGGVAAAVFGFILVFSTPRRPRPG